MNPSFHPDAHRELMEAMAWYHSRNPSVAVDLDSSVAATLLRIMDFPEFYTPVYGEFRRARIDTVFPYSLIYRTHKNTLFVIAFPHDKREPDYWKNRIH